MASLSGDSGVSILLVVFFLAVGLLGICYFRYLMSLLSVVGGSLLGSCDFLCLLPFSALCMY